MRVYYRGALWERWYRQAGRQERIVKWSEFKEATVVAQTGSLDRDKESHVTHIKGRLKVSKPKEKAKVEGAPTSIAFTLSQSNEGANLTVLPVRVEL